MSIQKDLIYDIGLHDGKDTEYYLHKGYTVIAVDANPDLIKKAEKAYSNYIKQGKLKLLNIAISDTEGELTFSISNEDQFSSLEEEAAKRGGINKKVTVKSRKLSTLFNEYGVPTYCKIDIEGHDAIALQTLYPAQVLPEYISVESEIVLYNSTIEEEAILHNLNLLQQLGYTKFKLVDQDSLAPLEPNKTFYTEGPVVSQSILSRGYRFLKRKAGFTKLRPYLQYLKDKHGFTFTRGSSGPFGEEVDGEWYDYDMAKKILLEHRKDYHSLNRASYFGFWCDWHAKLR